MLGGGVARRHGPPSGPLLTSQSEGLSLGSPSFQWAPPGLGGARAYLPGGLVLEGGVRVRSWQQALLTFWGEAAPPMTQSQTPGA